MFTMSRCFSFASAVGCGSLEPSVGSSILSSGSGLAADARVLGLSVSVTDDHLALTTAARQLLLLDVTAAAAAMDEAAEATAAATASPDASAKGGSSSVGWTGTASAAESAEAGLCSSVEADHDSAELNASCWQVVCAGFSYSRVVGLDACQHLPLLMVVSDDRWGAG